MKAGIVGLPNVGKSTLFNCLSNTKAQSANFPFCTIEPNIGIINVPDKRLEKLEKLEQLRWLQNGFLIYAYSCDDVGIAIDTPEDIVKAEIFLKQNS